MLDWILEAFDSIKPRVVFVGGYDVDAVAAEYPAISYRFNPLWSSTLSASSLFVADPPQDADVYVCYSDTLFRRDVVERLSASRCDFAVAYDSNWKQRFVGRPAPDIAKAEKASFAPSRIRFGLAIDASLVDGEFIGLWRASPQVIAAIARFEATLAPGARDRLAIPDLLNHLVSLGFSVDGIDVKGDWSELNDSRDIAHFVFGTKAETLARLRPMLRSASIAEQETFNVSEWEHDSATVVERISARFGPRELIVRSSAVTEDGWQTASAGVYCSVAGVSSRDAVALRRAVDEVIDSYPDRHTANQVLVQPLLGEVSAAGVALTRTLSFGAPYYVVNFEIEGSTAGVTSGTGRNIRKLVVHRNAAQEIVARGADDLPAFTRPLLLALGELEELLSHDRLDVEFAVTGADRVHVLQVRPIAATDENWVLRDSEVERKLVDAEQRFQAALVSRPRVVGTAPIYGVMPDWNPAEIIGLKPRRLAVSLYREVIMDDVWATQRAEFGYRDVRPHPLMQLFAGTPYVDVRASFNSFIPAELPGELAARLVSHYLDRLRTTPQLHDKIEFDVAFTFLSFDFHRSADRLRQAGFSTAEIDALAEALKGINARAIGRGERDLVTIALLGERLSELENSPLGGVEKALALLYDTTRYGTLPFAHLARLGFIATGLLQSGVSAGIVPAHERDSFLESISTVATDFVSDGHAVAAGTLTYAEFASRYGHLRPGTYEITSPRFLDDSERYLSQPVHLNEISKDRCFAWSPDTQAKLIHALPSVGFSPDLQQFENFLRRSIEGREMAKLAFTRGLSCAIECIADFGDANGLSRDQISHIPLDTFKMIAAGLAPPDIRSWLERCAREGEDWHGIVRGIELPTLIARDRDFRIFLSIGAEPNFITGGKVKGDVIVLTERMRHKEALSGRIILVTQADPGYDWLFACGIAGLVTAFGGVNSHMAIRAAEFRLPAAIGVGPERFAELSNARVLELDCGSRSLRIVE